MADETDKPVPIETIPSVRGGLSALGSANAPFVYFESVPFFGFLNGIAQLTLEVGRVFGADPVGKPN